MNDIKITTKLNQMRMYYRQKKKQFRYQEFGFLAFILMQIKTLDEINVTNVKHRTQMLAVSWIQDTDAIQSNIFYTAREVSRINKQQTVTFHRICTLI